MALPSLQRELSGQRIVDPTRSPEQRDPISLSDVLRRAEIQDDLAVVDRLMLARTVSRSPLLAAAGAYTIASGGKRLRAALVLLAARLGVYNLDRAEHPAASIELLHAASLIHDDLVDHAGQRRGRATVHSRWDGDVALILGDYFFGMAAGELADEPDSRIIRFYVHAAQTMVEGELSPVRQLEPLETALAQYRNKIGCKTAVLFQVACQAGITVSGGDEEQIAALGCFGYDLGMAFQIVDDVLDFTGDEAILGKPAGNDLREGTLTLPLIYGLAQSESPLLREISRTGRADLTRIPQSVAAVIAAGGTDRAMEEARATANRAISHLAGFPYSNTRRALEDICEFVLNRQQ